MKPMKSKLKIKSTSGITLIALIVTIIVLLILAGVGISMLMGENGVLQWTDKNGNTAYNNYLSLKIGGSAYYGHGGLNGYYKDILIYNRALSNDEIQDMNIK